MKGMEDRERSRVKENGLENWCEGSRPAHRTTLPTVKP
jgi:hypothetical protein